MAKIITLFMARHGNTFENSETPIMIGKTDLPLTELGKIQAKNLGFHFQQNQIPIKKIVVGNLKRQIETAKIIQNTISFRIDLMLESALNEIDYGAWEGLTSAQIQIRWPTQYEAWTGQGMWPSDIFKPSFQECIEKLRLWLNFIMKSSQHGDTVLGISSNGLIRLLLYFVPQLWQNIAQEKQFPQYKIKTGNFCKFKLTDDTLSIEEWNRDPLTMCF